MLILDLRSNEILLRSLRAAVMFHRPAVLRGLLISQGHRTFARALSSFSSRTIADALFMLAVKDRVRVMECLPRAARNSLSNTGVGNTHSSNGSSATFAFPSYLTCSSAPESWGLWHVKKPCTEKASSRI
jgi:hypothetical protein